MTDELRENIKDQIVEYIKLYNNGGEPIGAEKIIRLLENGKPCICPLCLGAGQLSVSIIIKYPDIKAMAKKLRKKNMTIRQIANELGFKHPGSITHLLKP